MRCIYIDKDSVKSLSDIYDLFANALDFPEYFGKNLDALYDCLTDVSEDVLIVLSEKSYLRELAGSKADAFFETLNDVIKNNKHITICELEQEKKMKYTQEQIDELAKKAGEAAGNNFMAGYNCCEAAFGAVLDLGLSDLPKEAVMVASGMGGGVGGYGSLCGAINGGGLGIGALEGRKNPTAMGEPKACKNELHDSEYGLYRFSKAYIEELNAKFGSVNCKDLIAGYDMADPEQRKAKVLHCKEIASAAAELAVRKAFEFEAKQETKEK